MALVFKRIFRSDSRFYRQSTRSNQRRFAPRSNQGAVLQAFVKPRASSADVQIIYDARQIDDQENPTRIKLQPREANRRTIAAAGLDDACILRTSDPRRRTRPMHSSRRLYRARPLRSATSHWQHSAGHLDL